MYSNFSVNLTEIVAQMLFLVFRKAARVCGAFAIPLRTMNLDCDADAVTIGLRGECMYAVNSQNCYSTGLKIMIQVGAS